MTIRHFSNCAHGISLGSICRQCELEAPYECGRMIECAGMTDPMYNPQTGHGVECLCDRCICEDSYSTQRRFEKFLAMQRLLMELSGTDHPLAAKARRILSGDPAESRVITRVMTDGISTKDGLS